jgi:hypothetical protein
MAAAQTAEQKAAAEKAEAERLASEQAEAERIAAAQTAESEDEPPAPLYVVTGAAVVLPLESGSERYLYRGNPIGGGYTKAGIEHALSIGLIERVS